MRGFWKHTPLDLRENPEPNPASKGIETGWESPLNDLSSFLCGACGVLVCLHLSLGCEET